MRARIGALSGMAGGVERAGAAWWDENAALRTDGAPTPDEEYLIYQTLVGAWPLERERLQRVHGQGDARGEGRDGLGRAGRGPRAARSARSSTASTRRRASSPASRRSCAVATPAGEAAALGQTLLKLTSPGVPDIYQGDELWDLALVDPDNRRPVDWERCATLLDELESGAAPRRETAKMFLIHRALALRARRPEAFEGDYTPLDAGPDAFAYARGGEVIAATPLRAGGGGTVAVPEALRGAWTNVLTGDDHDLGAEVAVDDLRGPARGGPAGAHPGLSAPSGATASLRRDAPPPPRPGGGARPGRCPRPSRWRRSRRSRPRPVPPVAPAPAAARRCRGTRRSRPAGRRSLVAGETLRGDPDPAAAAAGTVAVGADRRAGAVRPRSTTRAPCGCASRSRTPSPAGRPARPCVRAPAPPARDLPGDAARADAGGVASLGPGAALVVRDPLGRTVFAAGTRRRSASPR